jgi:hypothetical protein
MTGAQGPGSRAGSAGRDPGEGSSGPASAGPRRTIWKLGAATIIAVAALACGGSDSTMSPSPAPPGATINITSGGVTPKVLTVTRGSQVTFVNNDSRPHFMQSDPHPEHTDCPEINSVGTLSPGQSRQTGNLNTSRTCGYHDHNDAENSNLKGSIVIQ